MAASVRAEPVSFRASNSFTRALIVVSFSGTYTSAFLSRSAGSLSVIFLVFIHGLRKT